MKRFVRPRTWIRLVVAIMVALIALGWACRRHAENGIWYPGSAPSILYVDPELAAYGYQCYGSVDWFSSDFFLERTPPIDPSDWDVVREAPSPAWAVDAAKSGFDSAWRSEIGWPLRYARVDLRESEVETDETYYQALHAKASGFINICPEIVAERTGYLSIGPVSIATRPLFPGFPLLVAVLYGLLLVGERALRIPNGVRTRRRKRRGCCTVCGYDLVGIGAAVCPECGANHA